MITILHRRKRRPIAFSATFLVGSGRIGTDTVG